MNIIISMKNTGEGKMLESAFRKESAVNKIQLINDLDFAISKMVESMENIGIFDVDSFKEDVFETLSSIRDMKDLNPEAKVILIANKDDEVIITAGFRFGINYVVVRPYEIETVVNRVMDLGITPVFVVNENQNKYAAAERITSSILNSTGILPNLKGYKYLKEAIVMGYKDRSVLDAVTKFLYPEIAKDNNTTSDRVERAIRHAIESAWSKCGGNGFYNKMGFANAYSQKRPTNSEYIFSVVEYLNNSNL